MDDHSFSLFSLSADQCTTMDRELVCSKYGKKMRSYAEVGYDGPERDGKPDLGNEDCNVPMNWMLLCN